jgi:hypothetical protein
MTSKSVNAPREHNNKSQYKQRGTDEEHPKSQSSSSSGTPDRTPPTNGTNGSDDSERNGTPWWRILLRILEGVAALAVIAYAVVTGLMWQDSHNNFIVAERGWLSVNTVAIDPANIKEGTPIQTLGSVMNSGKTACKKIWMEFQIEVFKNVDKVGFDYASPYITKLNLGLLSPNAGSPFPIRNVHDRFQVEQLTKDQADDLRNGRAYIAVYGRGTYWDMFGKQHWFHECGWKSYYAYFGGTGGEYEASECVNYNDIGDGNLPDADASKNK